MINKNTCICICKINEFYAFFPVEQYFSANVNVKQVIFCCSMFGAL